MENIDVSVIIVSFNNKEITKNCIKSIYEKTENINFNIYVVDNNSQDGTVEMIEEEFPNIKLIKNKENKGFGAANNIAIKQSDSKYVFLLNPDTLLINNAIKILFDFMEENPDVGACGGNLFDKNLNEIHVGGHFPSAADILFKFGLNKIFKDYFINELSCEIFNKRDKASCINYITGADLFIRKSVLDTVGLFDENYFMYFEESDLEKRIWESGSKIMFVPDSKIIHIEGASLNNNYKKRKLFKKSQFYYFKKHKGILMVIFIKIVYIIAYFIEFLIKRDIDSLKIIKTVIKS